MNSIRQETDKMKYTLTFETDATFNDAPELNSIISISNDSPHCTCGVNIDISSDARNFFVQEGELHFMLDRSTASSVAEIGLIPTTISTSQIKRILSVIPQHQPEKQVIKDYLGETKLWTLVTKERNYVLSGETPFECFKYSNDKLYFRGCSLVRQNEPYTLSWQPLESGRIQTINEGGLKDSRGLWSVEFNEDKEFSILALIEAFQQPDKMN
jgi:hypothetical protein